MTRCLTADPVNKTVSVGSYTGSVNQKWSMAISSSGNALRSESTDSRIKGYKLYLSGSTFKLSNTSFTSVGFYRVASYVPPTALSGSALYLAPEQGRYYYPTKTPSNANSSTNWTVWSRGNTKITVNQSGLVTGVTPGESSITFRDKITQISGTAKVYISEAAQGVYFIQNRTYERFAQIDNDKAPNYSASGAAIEQFPIDGGDYQKWNLTALGDGYYKILSVKSGLALSVKAGHETSKMGDIIQEAYTGATRQQWKIIKTANGSYKIKARSSEGYTTYDLVLDVNTQGLHSVDGLNLKQREYVNNTSYKDEWFLFRVGTEIGIVGIATSGHDHDSCYNGVLNSLAMMGNYNTVSCNLVSIMTKSECLGVLQNSRVFVSRSHGGYSATSSYIATKSDGSMWMSSVDIYNFDTNTVLKNLNGVYLAVYSGCHTAYGGTGSSARNLVTASVKAGADYAIGFADSIDCDAGSEWLEVFFEYLSDDNSVLDAVLYATNSVANSGNGIASCRVAV